MVKSKFPRYKWKTKTSRQTRWSRRRKKLQNVTRINDPSGETKDDISNDDCDGVSVTGDVFNEIQWDISSVSSEDSEDHLVLTDDDDYSDDSNNSEDITYDCKFNEFLYTDAELSLVESLHLVLAFS
ncbi:unnamed protein product, partial [Allacma fusca]